MTEILYRKIELPMAQNLRGKKVQISYNSNKHLAVRFFDDKKREYVFDRYEPSVLAGSASPMPEKDSASPMPEKDMIIVFDESTTRQIVNFIRETIK